MILDLDTLLIGSIVILATAAVAAVALAWDIRHHTRPRPDRNQEPVPPEWVNHPTPTPRPCGRPKRDYREDCTA